MNNEAQGRIAADWQQVRNLLVIRLDSLGDVLMTTPAVRALRESLPGSKITLLTSPSGAALAPYVPEVDYTLIYEAPWMKATAPRLNSQPDLEMIEQLRALEFDAAVIFTVYSQNPLPAALMCFLADIPLRLAYCRENPYQLLTNRVEELEPDKIERHEVQRHLDLVGELGFTTVNLQMSFVPTEQDRKKVKEHLHQAGIDDSAPWILIHPGATAPSRRYPPELFAQVARQLARQGIQVVFTGSGGEQDLIEQIRQMINAASYSLAGQLSLGELGAVIAEAPVIISNNTGPVHIAAAVGTRVVDLYALTNPQHTPWFVPHITLAYDVPCKFCYKSICPEGHHNCLRKIDPAWVVEAALTLLRGESPEHFYQRAKTIQLFRDFPNLDITPAH